MLLHTAQGTRSMENSRFLGLAYLSPYIIGLLAFTAVPFIASFGLSFTDYDLLSPAKWVGFENYIDLFTKDRTFQKSLSVTLFYVFITVPLKLAFALFIAYILNYKLKFINIFRTAYYGIVEDLFFWKKEQDGNLKSINYDYKNRSRRQDISKQYVENGSFYIFKPEVLRRYNNRLGGKIGMTQMEIWKMFEIDSLEDLKMCEALMRAFLLR